MSVMLMKAIIEKKLKVQKAANVQGSVSIHFPNEKIEDIILNDYGIVDVYARINVTSEEIKKSNLALLLGKGIVKIV